MTQGFRKMDSGATIYCINGMFLVFNKDDAIILRKKRIIGQLIGCSPKSPNQIIVSGLPYYISHYAARIVFENKIAKFTRMFPRKDISTEKNEALYQEKLLKSKDEASREYLERRASELKKREIDAPINGLDHNKFKLIISNKPDHIYYSFDTKLLDHAQVASIIETHEEKMIVYRDLYKNGFYVTSGVKFGCDFLVYLGDPVRYHAKYAVRVVANLDGRVDLNEISYSEINALNRLCHTANKITLFAIVYQGQTLYWSLKTREYLTSDSENSVFDSISPLK